MTVFMFDYRRPGINFRSIDDQLPHLVEICGRYRLWESQFPSKNWRDPDFVWFDVHIWRDDRTSGVINTFTLR